MKVSLILILLALNIQLLCAQDLQLSQYTQSPTFLNPALTGFSNGNLRVNANYRNQWFALNSFSTYLVTAEANILRQKLDYSLLGVGVHLYQDIEETQGVSNLNFGISTAYNIKLTKKPLQYLGFGIQSSLVKRRVNLMDAKFSTYFETGTNFDPIMDYNLNKFKFDLNLGASYFVKTRKDHMMNMGFSVGNVLRADYGAIGADATFRKYSSYFISELDVDNMGTLWFKPSVFLSFQGKSMQFIPGMAVRIAFFEAYHDVRLTLGAAMRFIGDTQATFKGGDFIAYTQFQFNEYSIGLSYDITVSDAKQATTKNGAIEVSLGVDLEFERRKPRYFRIMNY